MKKLILTLLVSALTTGCANYKLGDVSKRYCNEADPVVKQALKVQITKLIGELPVDYCLTKTIVLGK